jgi:hypothetical protein
MKMHLVPSNMVSACLSIIDQTDLMKPAFDNVKLVSKKCLRTGQIEGCLAPYPLTLAELWRFLR